MNYEYVLQFNPNIDDIEIARQDILIFLAKNENGCA